MKKLTTLIALAAIAGSASAALLVDTVNSQAMIDFESDIAGVYSVQTGAAHLKMNVSETDNWNRLNKGPGMISESFATRHTYHDGDGTGAGSSSRFGTDGNNNGTTDEVLGSNQLGMEEGLSGGAGNHAYVSTLDNQWAPTGLYLRIQNTTGSTVADWNFALDVFFNDDDSGASTLTFSYAVTDTTNPNLMTFTSFGPSFTSVNGDVYADLDESLDADVSASVANNGYIVFQVADSADGGGSGVVLDNIGVTAIPEPATLGLVATFAGMALFIRRRLMM